MVFVARRVDTGAWSPWSPRGRGGRSPSRWCHVKEVSMPKKVDLRARGDHKAKDPRAALAAALAWAGPEVK